MLSSRLRLVLAASVVSIAACVVRGSPPPPTHGPSSNAERDRYSDELIDIEAKYQTSRWHETCGGNPRPKNCGLVYDEITEAESSRRFVAKVCDEQVDRIDTASPNCRKRFRKMFLARVVERYHEVSAERLRQHCDGYPESCRKPRAVELWMLKAHNDVVRDQYRDDVARTREAHASRAEAAREERSRKEREAAQRTLNALDDIVDASLDAAH